MGSSGICVQLPGEGLGAGVGAGAGALSTSNGFSKGVYDYIPNAGGDIYKSKITKEPRRSDPDSQSGGGSGIFLFSHPRTASNLFLKLFSQHPQLTFCEYPFKYAYFIGPEAQCRLPEELDASESLREMRIAKRGETFQVAVDGVERRLFDPRNEGKVVFFKEHATHMTRGDIIHSMISNPDHLPSKPIVIDHFLDLRPEDRHQAQPSPSTNSALDTKNPLILPDRLVLSLHPIFTIRHPAKQVGSYYRASQILQTPVDHQETKIECTYKFVRLLFDYYKAAFAINSGSDDAAGGKKGAGVWPVVIDGDDLINDTERIANNFCEIASLDPKGIIYKWEKGKPESNPFEAVFKDMINNSHEVVKNSTTEKPSIAKEAVVWEEKWGAEVAKALVKYAEDAMEDYEYLCQFRL